MLALAILSAAAFAQGVLTVRIGQVDPTAGPAAHLGKDNANGARLAIADLNARGLAELAAGAATRWHR